MAVPSERVWAGASHTSGPPAGVGERQPKQALVRDEGVAGSNPATPTNTQTKFFSHEIIQPQRSRDRLPDCFLRGGFSGDSFG